MAIIPITTLPGDAEVLRATARRVKKVDGSVERLVEDMIDSVYAASGVGIAAPQIGVSLKVVVFTMPGEKPFALINPEVVKRSGSRVLLEGCLSVPGWRGYVVRSRRVLAKGMDLQGREVRIRSEDDLLAQALEHEIDHVNGTIYIDHIRQLEDLFPLAEADADEDETEE